MRIAILSTGFCDSTLALVRALSEKGHTVDYYLCWFNKELGDQTCFEAKIPERKYGKIYELTPNNTIGVNFLKDTPQSKLYLFQGFKTGKNSNGLKKLAVQQVFNFYLQKLVYLIKHRNYDFVDCITQEPLLKGLYKHFPSKFIFSFHEVLDNHLHCDALQPIVNTALENNVPIRVFSGNTQKHLLEYNTSKNARTYVVPFGLYHNFHDFDHIINDKLKFSKYILFYGYLFPEYKGLPVLFSAIDILEKKGLKVNVVVAGKGQNKALDMIKGKSNFDLKHKFITNAELVHLIDKSRFIVCPYISASQSGIPQTTYVYNKPLVATTVGEFSNLIDNTHNGLLVAPNDPESLALAIERLWLDDSLYSEFCDNLRNFENNNNEYNWDSIVHKYETMINGIIQNRVQSNKK